MLNTIHRMTLYATILHIVHFKIKKCLVKISIDLFPIYLPFKTYFPHCVKYVNAPNL